MDLGKIPLLSMLTQRMAWLGQRQQVLAQNIANADTPGYKPRDVREPDFFSLAAGEARRLGLAATDGRHLSGGSRALAFREEIQTQNSETNAQGNAVVIEEQLTKMAETVVEHQLMTSLYRKHVKMIRSVLGNG